MLHLSSLNRNTSQCCEIGAAFFEEYNEDEQSALRENLSSVKSVITLAHHVTNSFEFVWFPSQSERLNETCPADLHLQLLAQKICENLHGQNYTTKILPYPGICGPMFKTLAVKSGLGELGDNYLFMNKKWGPWIHLRIILTDAKFEHTKPNFEPACTHCGLCTEACPVNAIGHNDFNGIKCRDYMRAKTKQRGNSPNIFECEKCLRACPIGEEPSEIEISFK